MTMGRMSDRCEECGTKFAGSARYRRSDKGWCSDRCAVIAGVIEKQAIVINRAYRLGRMEKTGAGKKPSPSLTEGLAGAI